MINEKMTKEEFLEKIKKDINQHTKTKNISFLIDIILILYFIWNCYELKFEITRVALGIIMPLVVIFHSIQNEYQIKYYKITFKLFGKNKNE